jgi:hypothetical protein
MLELKELGALTDRLHKVREDRIAADKVAASLKEEEQRLYGVVVAAMEEQELSSVGGKVAIVHRGIKRQPYAMDWDRVYKYITENEAYDLLHKRLTFSAVLDRLDDGEHIPGIGVQELSFLTYAKART